MISLDKVINQHGDVDTHLKERFHGRRQIFEMERVVFAKKVYASRTEVQQE
jgi:hypothetical protein